MVDFPKSFHFTLIYHIVVLQPRLCRNITGLGSFPFARHYSGNHYCFLFLRLLRCFSSAGLRPPKADNQSSTSQVSPFGNLRINSYLLIPEAYRSLSRPSSPLRAQASPVCPFLLSSSNCLLLSQNAFWSLPVVRCLLSAETNNQQLPTNNVPTVVFSFNYFFPICQRTFFHQLISKFANGNADNHGPEPFFRPLRPISCVFLLFQLPIISHDRLFNLSIHQFVNSSTNRQIN